MTEENKIYLPLDLPPDLYDWLCEDAAAHQRTFEEHITYVLKNISLRDTGHTLCHKI
jgi:hypothetical protein